MKKHNPALIKKIDKKLAILEKMLRQKLKWKEFPIWRLKYILNIKVPLDEGITFRRAHEEYKKKFVEPFHEFESNHDDGSDEFDEKLYNYKLKETSSDDYGIIFLTLLKTIKTFEQAQEVLGSCIYFLYSFEIVQELIIELATTESHGLMLDSGSDFFDLFEYYDADIKQSQLLPLKELSFSNYKSFEIWHAARYIILERLIKAATSPEALDKINKEFEIEYESDAEKIIKERYNEIKSLPLAKKSFKARNFDEAKKAMLLAGNDQDYDEALREMARLGTYQQLFNEIEDDTTPDRYIFAYRCLELSLNSYQAKKIADLFLADFDLIYWKAIERSLILARNAKEIDSILLELKENFDFDFPNPVRFMIVEKGLKIRKTIKSVISFCKVVEVEENSNEQYATIKKLFQLIKKISPYKI